MFASKLCSFALQNVRFEMFLNGLRPNPLFCRRFSSEMTAAEQLLTPHFSLLISNF
jgi:hypothetical protein